MDERSEIEMLNLQRAEETLIAQENLSVTDNSEYVWLSSWNINLRV